MEFDHAAVKFCPACGSGAIDKQLMEDGQVDFYCYACGKSGDITIDIDLEVTAKEKVPAIWYPQGNRGISGKVLLQYTNKKLNDKLFFFPESGGSRLVERTEIHVFRG